MYKVKTYNKIAQVGLDCLPSTQYKVDENIDKPDAILLRSQNLHDTDFPDTIKAVARAGAGVNNIPVDQLSARGVPVFNTPGANANAVKELVIAALLIASRNISDAISFTQDLSCDSDDLDTKVEQGKKQFVGTELPGKTIAVIGLGAIGVKVANACAALGLNVIGFDPGITITRAWELSATVVQAHSINEAIKQADFISLHVPFNKQTEHLFSAKVFAGIKPGATLVNCARGGIVDEKALLCALNDKVIKTYVTDFPSKILKDHKHVISLPHLGASTTEAEENCAIMAANVLRDFLEHGEIRNSVNFPEVLMPRTNGYRIGIANANVPNMLGQISTALANADLNIIDMLNKSRADVAYTLIDVEHPVGAATIEALISIQGVLKVNILGNNG